MLALCCSASSVITSSTQCKFLSVFPWAITNWTITGPLTVNNKSQKKRNVVYLCVLFVVKITWFKVCAIVLSIMSYMK